MIIDCKVSLVGAPEPARASNVVERLVILRFVYLTIADFQYILQLSSGEQALPGLCSTRFVNGKLYVDYG